MGDYAEARRGRPWPVRLWHELRSESTEQDRLIRLIILERLVKSAVLVVLAISLLAFGRHGQLYRIVAYLHHLHASEVRIVGLGALGYGVLELVEGVGLWLDQLWAEYLTVIATAVLIPFEVYELLHRVTVFRVLALAFNVLIVVYLAWRKRLFVTV